MFMMALSYGVWPTALNAARGHVLLALRYRAHDEDRAKKNIRNRAYNIYHKNQYKRDRTMSQGCKQCRDADAHGLRQGG